ncbi:MAG: branched-chain amino acid ABC transporter permease [Clostridiales Family XIII bacterium]|jgi:branched-chain amino acid transport system permease protein|nr:branched-chain amino acid ABC transporter permease [Clostridiales Family XIII bacterium]
MYIIIQSVITGILLGGLYAVIGVGMSLVFGIMRLTNIAHGDLMILASYFTMLFAMEIVGNVFLALLITIVLMLILSFLIQTFLVNRVIDKGPEPSLLVMFGVSIIIRNALILIFGANNRTIPNPLSTTNILNSPNISISGGYLVNFIVGVAVVLVLMFIIQKTYFGMSIRATASNRMGAELLGVNTKRIFAYTLCLAVATASIAGLLIGQTFVFYPSTGPQYLITAFGVVVIGGMGSLGGTLVGGILLGLVQLLSAHFFGTGWQTIAGYVFMLVILTIRPQGIFAKARR